MKEHRFSFWSVSGEFRIQGANYAVEQPKIYADRGPQAAAVALHLQGLAGYGGCWADPPQVQPGGREDWE